MTNFDKRLPEPGFDRPVGVEKTAAATRIRGAKAGARIDFDAITGGPKWIASSSGFLSGPGGKGIVPADLAAIPAQDPDRVTKAFLREHRDLFGHGPEALTGARMKREYSTPHHGLRTVVWEQQLDGIAVFESVLISHTTRNGELVSIGSTFLADLTGAAEAGTPGRAALVKAPIISSRRAVVLAAASLGETIQEETVAQKTLPSGNEQSQQLQAAGLNGEVQIRLIWLPMSPGAMRLCWDMTLTSKARGEMFRMLVDVRTGEVLLRRCLTAYLSEASYRVFTSDSPSPFSPAHATPLTNQPPLATRALIT